jgi:hypothetical protein
LSLLLRFEPRRGRLLRALDIAAAVEAFGARLLALFASLGAVFLDRLIVALLLVAVPSAMVLGESGRSCCAGQKNGDQNFTHDGDFLSSLTCAVRFSG